MKEEKAKKDDIEWDKRKILLFLIASVILLSIGYELKTMMLGDSSSVPSSANSVKGASIQNYPSPPDISGGIQNQINNLKTEAQNINVADVATSSAQVQKVINDLKAIQNYPKNQLKSTCEQICNGL